MGLERKAQLETGSAPSWRDTLGLYVHIPFCISKCPYCDFNSVAGAEALIPEYLSALKVELRQRAGPLVGRGRGLSSPPSVAEACRAGCSTHALTGGGGDRDPGPTEGGVLRRRATVYFGGGTPTVLDGDDLTSLLRDCVGCLRGREVREVTVEANPGTVSAEKLKMLREAGVNRISIGVQSFDDRTLRALGRAHSAAEAVAAVEAADAAGCDNISLDLMFGVPGQTLGQWLSDLETAIELEPEHISVYGLTYEEGTPLRARCDRGEVCSVDEETELAMYRAAVGRLEAAGLWRYEISNFARSGLECRHNMTYWRGGEYVGIGAGAHSFLGGTRSWNVRALQEYITRVASGGGATEGSERLTGRAALGEALMLGLRMTSGVCLGELEARHGLDPAASFAREFEHAAAEGLLDVSDGRARLTDRGVELSDEVFLMLV